MVVCLILFLLRPPTPPPTHPGVVPVRVATSLSTVGVGRDVTLSCSGTRPKESSDIPQTFLWSFMRRGGSATVLLLPTEGRLDIVSDEEAITSSLTVRAVTHLDAGTYVCSTRNPIQTLVEASSNVTLDVEGM